MTHNGTIPKKETRKAISRISGSVLTQPVYDRINSHGVWVA